MVWSTGYILTLILTDDLYVLHDSWLLYMEIVLITVIILFDNEYQYLLINYYNVKKKHFFNFLDILLPF